jgi:membrane fusion protein, adhesin transport system
MSELSRHLGEAKTRIKLLFDPGVVPLNQAIELEERPPAKSLTQLVYMLMGIVVAGLLWSAVTYVDIVASAPGRVAPAGDVISIQHLDGGIVSQILVAEGERVAKGQVLVHLAPLDTEGRIAQMRAKRTGNLLAIEAERALIEGREPNFDRVVTGFARQKTEQLSLFNARRQSVAAQQSVLIAQRDQRDAQVRRLSAQLIMLRHDEEIAAEELKVRSDLWQRKLTTRDRYYAAQREAADRQKQRMGTRDELARADNELAEFDRKLTEFDATLRSDSQAAIAKATAELAEIDAVLQNEQGRANRLNVRAPVAGIVTGVTVRAVNAVVKPGESLMEIVPSADPLVVMAEISPQDIGQVRVGQRADIRVSAFDYTTFGTLQGTVDRISATTFADGDRRRFYKVRVRLARDYLGGDPKVLRVLPGMEVDVDVKTGFRSVLAYLLKPVMQTRETAFREL